MMPSFRQLLEMVARSIRSPREGTAEVLSFGVPQQAIWLLIALVAVIYTAFNHITILILVRVYSGIIADYPEVATQYPDFARMYEDLSLLLEANVLPAALLQFLMQLATIVAIHRIGQGFGGTGSLGETAVLMSWFHFVMICLGTALLGLLLTIPILGLFGLFPLLFLVLRMLVVFVASLHGFPSLGQAILTLVLAYVAVTMFRILLVGILSVGAGTAAGGY